LRGAVDVEFAVEGDDSAEGRRRVGAVGARIRIGQGGAERHSAGIGVLDDDAGRKSKLAHAFERGVAVGDVVVREFLALYLPALRHGCADGARVGVESGLLMRVLAVAQIAPLAEGQIQIVREGGVPPPMAPVK